MSIGFRQRHGDRWERAIDALDPVADAHAVVRILSNHLFPLDLYVSSELAQLKTFSIPTISRLLHATGEYERDGRRRVDDTKAILSEILVPGPMTPEGEEMVEHLNRIHARYTISNDDLLYTLGALIEEPVRWVADFGWRPLRERERDGIFELYMQLGRKMKIRDLPASYDALVTWLRAYERRCQHYAASNEQVARGLLRVIEGDVPAPARRWVEPVLASLLEESVVAALGLRAPRPSFRGAVRALMRVRQRSARRITFWDERAFWDSQIFRRVPSYPYGYDRSRLGPRKIVEAIERERREREARRA